MASLIKNIYWSSVDTMVLDGNMLTKVPSGLVNFTQLSTLSMAYNQITSILSNDLTLSAELISLDLSNNTISDIETGALPGIS